MDCGDHDGRFVGDCGLTWQEANGATKLEVGYHVRHELRGRGYATEAATTCRDLAQYGLGAGELVAIIDPLNTASRRVAEKIGMTHVSDDTSGHLAVRVVMGMRFAASV